MTTFPQNRSYPDAADYCLLPDHHTPGWSESRWITAYDPARGIGIFFHAGRVPADLTVWWSHMVVYLPDGRIVVNRSWGTPPDPRECGTGNVRLVTVEPWRRWRLSFAGAGQETTARQSALAPVGAGWPTVPMSLELTGSAAAPPWSALHGITEVEWAAGHFEQGFHISGQISVGGDYYEIDGLGGTDHSFGPRSWSNFASHNFILAVMPDYVFHTIEIWDHDDRPLFYVGARFDDRGQTALTAAEFPRVDDLAGPHETFDIRLVDDDQQVTTLTAEVLHSVATTNTADKDCIIGVDWDVEPCPYVPVESIIRLTAPDGTVGYGHTERSRLRDAFDRRTGRLVTRVSDRV